MRNARIALVIGLIGIFAFPLLAGGRVIIGTRENPPEVLRQAQQIIATQNDLGTDPTNPDIIAAIDAMIAGTNSVVYFERSSITNECSDFESLVTLGTQLCSAKGSTVMQARASGNNGMVWCANGLFLRVDQCSE